MTLLYSEWHLIPRWPLRSIFARFPEQFLKDLVCWGSDGECSMIDLFLGDAFGVLSCQFWSTVLRSGARLPIHTLIKLLDCAVSGARFLTGGVFGCDIAHRRSWKSFVCFIRSGVTRCTLLMVLYLDHMCQAGYARCSGRTTVHLCTASQQNLAVQQNFYSPLVVPLDRSC